MNLQAGVSPIHPADHPRVVEVWEASVRATHHFVSEADIEFFRPLVRDALNHVPALAARLAEASAAKYGYAPKPEDYETGGVYVFRPRVVFAWSQGFGNATRWHVPPAS